MLRRYSTLLGGGGAGLEPDANPRSRVASSAPTLTVAINCGGRTGTLRRSERAYWMLRPIQSRPRLEYFRGGTYSSAPRVPQLRVLP
jgi:hypothetical protein